MLYTLLTLVVLCFDSVQAAQPSAVKPRVAPLRDLQFGELNFLHTTDTHGWHAGHLLEASYSADWGDYIDFSDRLREQLESEGKDLLVIDTGDRIEGNGLYDASDPKGKFTFEIFKEQKIDLICSGNHELYKQNSSENEYLITVPAYKDNYLASNLDIIDPETGKIVPLAPRYKKFTTPNQGFRIMAFGFIFNFQGNYNNTIITPVEETIQKDWFQKAIRDREIDLFVVIGHVTLRSEEFDHIYKAIREVRWDTPIQFFGGHFHIRDYRVFDSKAHGLASGRFMETIGFQSIDGIKAGSKVGSLKSSPRFFRRYIDNNLYSLYHHSGHNESTFHSKRGRKVSKMIEHARTELELDETFGCAEQDLWMSRAKYPSNSSIFTWLVEEVLPDVVDKNRMDEPRMVMTNTGAIRFDIFKGPFTKDSTYIVCPFTSGFHFLKNVPYNKAKKLLGLLNNAGDLVTEQQHAELETWKLAPPEQYLLTENIFHSQDPTSPLTVQHPFSFESDEKAKVFPGYTTKDDLGNDGDDTIHSPISFYRVPNVVESVYNPDAIDLEEEDDTSIDLVFNEFLQPWVLFGLNFLGLEYTDVDVAQYLPGKDFTTVIADWVSINWAKNCQK